MNLKRVLKVSGISFLIGFYLFAPVAKNKEEEEEEKLGSFSDLIKQFNIKDEEIKKIIMDFEKQRTNLKKTTDVFDFQECHLLEKTIVEDLRRLLVSYYELGYKKQAEQKDVLLFSISKLITYLEKAKDVKSLSR